MHRLKADACAHRVLVSGWSCDRAFRAALDCRRLQRCGYCSCADPASGGGAESQARLPLTLSTCATPVVTGLGYNDTWLAGSTDANRTLLRVNATLSLRGCGLGAATVVSVGGLGCALLAAASDNMLRCRVPALRSTAPAAVAVAVNGTGFALSLWAGGPLFVRVAAAAVANGSGGSGGSGGAGGGSGGGGGGGGSVARRPFTIAKLLPSKGSLGGGTLLTITLGADSERGALGNGTVVMLGSVACLVTSVAVDSAALNPKPDSLRCVTQDATPFNRLGAMLLRLLRLLLRSLLLLLLSLLVLTSLFCRLLRLGPAAWQECGAGRQPVR